MKKKLLKPCLTVPDRWDWVSTGETYASKWAASDADGKRDMLKTAKIYAAKNEHGEAYVIIETVNEHGQIDFRAIGNPPGPSLMERAKAKGLDKLVDVDAELDD